MLEHIMLSFVSIFGYEFDWVILQKSYVVLKDVKQNDDKLMEELLMGVPECYENNSFYRNKVLVFLKKVFDISSNNDFIKVIGSFEKGSSVKTLFDKHRAFLNLISYDDRILYKKSIMDDNEKLLRLDIVNSYDKVLPLAGIRAFDISNCICLYRFGLYLGYIDRQSAICAIEKLANEAFKSYLNYEEYGIASIVGVLFYIGKYDLESYGIYTSRLREIINKTSEYWREIEWNSLEI
jgi:hypothetical protein